MVDYPSDAETEAGYSIASRTRETLTSFGEVISLQEPGSERQNELEDSQSRFRVWAGNIGALASGKSIPEKHEVLPLSVGNLFTPKTAITHDFP